MTEKKEIHYSSNSYTPGAGGAGGASGGASGGSDMLNRKLPPSLKLSIIEYLDLEDLIELSYTNKRFEKMCMKICHTKFQVNYHLNYQIVRQMTQDLREKCIVLRNKRREGSISHEEHCEIKLGYIRNLGPELLRRTKVLVLFVHRFFPENEIAISIPWLMDGDCISEWKELFPLVDCLSMSCARVESLPFLGDRIKSFYGFHCDNIQDISSLSNVSRVFLNRLNVNEDGIMSLTPLKHADYIELDLCSVEDINFDELSSVPHVKLSGTFRLYYGIIPRNVEVRNSSHKTTESKIPDPES